MNDGYTKIPNDFLEVLMSQAINDTERRVLLFLARKIYGFHKKSDRISNSQIEKGLNLAHSTVSLSLNRLKQVGIIILVSPGKSRKEPNEWLIDLSNISSKLVGIAKLVRYDREKLVGIVIHTKETIQKKENNRLLEDDSENKEQAGRLSADARRKLFNHYSGRRDG